MRGFKTSILLLSLLFYSCNHDSSESDERLQVIHHEEEENTSRESSDNDMIQDSEQIILDILSNKEHQLDHFRKINASPFLTSLNETKYIDLYVSDFAAQRYQNITPDTKGSLVEMPPSTVIIREVWNMDQTLDKYTIMMKQPSGYFPEGGDFFYAIVDKDFNYVKKGALMECAVCHIPRAEDGYLFGVSTHFHTEDSNEKDLFAEALITQRLASIAETTLINYQFLSDNFTAVSESQTSAANSQNLIDIYVSDFAADAYASIDFNHSGSKVKLPEESTIVRVVKDKLNRLKQYTVMVKGPKGFYPEGGDYFYAVYDSFLQLVFDQEGEEMQGQIDECAACHLSRPNDDYLFGVPK